MQDGITIAVTGDAIIHGRISVYKDERFLALIKILRDADVAYTHLEALLHDYDGPEVYPAAEAGWNALASPRFVANELKWAGFDIVSHATNHSLDYSYGGLTSTWAALDDAGLPYAGTGKNLGDARAPAYLDTEKGKVALISMCSTFTGWARAGDQRRDMKGRPGLNPLRFYYSVDAETLETLKHLAIKFGWWVTQVGQEWLFNPAGLHMAVHRFVVQDRPGVTPIVDEDDAEGNIRSIREARRQADWVIVHLHNHEWDAEKDLSVPPAFVPPFARACIDAGADVFVAEGSHSLLRGMEIYKDRPIFYDPGDLLRGIGRPTRQPSDYYFAPGMGDGARDWQATPMDAIDAYASRLTKPLNPPGFYWSGRVQGSVLAVCSFGGDRSLTEVKLYPVTHLPGPTSRRGLPLLAEPELGKEVIDYLSELSTPFGTEVEFKDGVGFAKLTEARS
ncbi:MAG: hypothetical protein EPO21_10555 [Chloroflexota bacterium]|nr:MAG: hypothetical protein EPO21_10555 [Chloroflexota bacterium]